MDIFKLCNDCSYIPSADCINRFVEVKYNSDTSTILCQFLTQTTTPRSCTIKYGQCTQMLIYESEDNSTLNPISLKVDPAMLECYVVTASSNEITVLVEGQRLMRAGNFVQHNSKFLHSICTH